MLFLVPTLILGGVIKKVVDDKRYERESMYLEQKRKQEYEERLKQNIAMFENNALVQEMGKKLCEIIQECVSHLYSHCYADRHQEWIRCTASFNAWGASASIKSSLKKYYSYLDDYDDIDYHVTDYNYDYYRLRQLDEEEQIALVAATVNIARKQIMPFCYKLIEEESIEMNMTMNKTTCRFNFSVRNRMYDVAVYNW